MVTREGRISYDWHTKEAAPKTLTRYIYNQDGTLKAKKYYYDDELQYKYRYTYNSKKQLTKEVFEDEKYDEYNYEMKYQYNKNGDLICKKEYKSGKLEYVYKYQYKTGNIVREKKYDKNMKPISLRKYTDYDKNGNNLRYADYDYDKNGKAKLSSVKKFVYDENNRQISYKSYDGNKKLQWSGWSVYNSAGDSIKDSYYTMEYKYDTNGNIVEKLSYAPTADEDYKYKRHVYTYKKIAIKD